MPSYQDAMAAEPSEFLALAVEATAAASDLVAHMADYGSKVGEINSHWKDTANDAFNGEVATVATHLGDVGGEIAAAATVLDASGLQMVSTVSALKIADTILKGTGFDILPSPLVTLSAAQRSLIASAGPLAGFMEAALQAQAAAGMLQLQSLLALVNAADAASGAVLEQIAAALKPLEDKAGAAQDDPAGTGTESGGTGEESGGEEEEPAEEEPEESEEDQEEDPAASESQQPETPQTPEDPSGLEDLARPETPELDNPWDASELPDPDDLSGGLASGGGLGSGGTGGGLGGAGLGTGAGAGAGAVPAGGMGGAMGAPVGAGAAGKGAKAGAGTMTGAGAGGGRGGGAGSDDEVSRDSNLYEDPDEDVWGIRKEGDDLYA